MLQPMECADYLFVRSFCSEDADFDNDLPLMMQDFLLHEGEKILEYSRFIYADDGFSNSGGISGMRYKFFNMVLAASRHGSAYAVEMLCRIYKIYYRKEYNQLKRFKTLSYDELTGFDNEEELFAVSAARILTIAPFMGIDVHPDCIFARDEIEEILEDRTFGYKPESGQLEFREGLFPQAMEDAKEILERFEKKDRDWFINNPVQKFLWKVFEYHCVPSDFDLLCEPFSEGSQRECAVTLSLLRTIWPRKSFSDEEVELFRAIYRSYTILIEHLICLDESLDMMLGRYDKFSFEMENSKYRPVSKKKVEVAHVAVFAAAAGEKAAVDRNVSRETESASPTAQELGFNDQIEHLQAELRAKEQTIQQLKRMYQEMSVREKQNRVDKDLLENDREELIRLRKALYDLTMEDLKSSDIPQDEMERVVCHKKIIIVGGHDNWVAYLRERFPDWVYIKPGISNTVPESAVIHADYLFFFTDTISHGAYLKFRKAVQTHHIPFGYLHGTNIPMTIRQIYEALT